MRANCRGCPFINRGPERGICVGSNKFLLGAYLVVVVPGGHRSCCEEYCLGMKFNESTGTGITDLTLLMIVSGTCSTLDISVVYELKM